LWHAHLSLTFGPDHQSTPILPSDLWPRQPTLRQEASLRMRWAQWIWQQASDCNNLQARQLVQKLLPRESRCFACGANRPTWVCVRSATVLCLNCAGDTRDCGTHIVLIRSMSMDIWKPNEVFRLAIGGNQRAMLYFLARSRDTRSLAVVEKVGLASSFLSTPDLYRASIAADYRLELERRDVLIKKWANIKERR